MVFNLNDGSWVKISELWELFPMLWASLSQHHEKTHQEYTALDKLVCCPLQFDCMALGQSYFYGQKL